MKSKQIPTWEQEFDEKFIVKHSNAIKSLEGLVITSPTLLKNFILSVRKEEYERGATDQLEISLLVGEDEIKKARKEEREKIEIDLQALIASNYEDMLGTYDYDGIAKDLFDYVKNKDASLHRLRSKSRQK